MTVNVNIDDLMLEIKWLKAENERMSLKLSNYEKLEQAGLLLKLPCLPDTDVWWVGHVGPCINCPYEYERNCHLLTDCNNDLFTTDKVKLNEFWMLKFLNDRLFVDEQAALKRVKELNDEVLARREK